MQRLGFAFLTSCVVAAKLWAGSPDIDPHQRGAQIIALAKTVTGGAAWDNVKIWHETGHAVADASGQVTRYEHWADFHSLKLRNITTVPRLRAMLFDGNSAYGCSDTNCDTPVTLDASSIRQGSYQSSYGFFFPDRFPATFIYEETRLSDGEPIDVVKVTPDGMASLDLWVSQRTHRITRMVYSEGRFHDDLSDYRKVGALTVPFVVAGYGAKVYTETIRLERSGAVDFSLRSFSEHK